MDLVEKNSWSDILRFTSQWTMGLPRGNGAITTAASFSGAISWQVSMFDVCKAGKWEEVIEALTSNVEHVRTNEVVLLFERPFREEGRSINIVGDIEVESTAINILGIHLVLHDGTT